MSTYFHLYLFGCHWFFHLKFWIWILEVLSLIHPWYFSHSHPTKAREAVIKSLSLRTVPVNHRKVQTNQQKSQFIPDKSQFVPDKGQFIPGTVQFIPDKSQGEVQSILMCWNSQQ